MTLEEYRENKNLSYEALSKVLGFSLNKTYRICKEKACVKLYEAQKIVQATQGDVDFEDLMPDECA